MIDFRLYQSKSAVREVLGCLLQNPKLLTEYKITENDFVEAFHKILFATINNKFSLGATKIDSVVIEEYLKDSVPVAYNIYNRNNGNLYVDKVKQLATLDNFKANYIELKKFSLLRNLINKGFDTTYFFDPNEVDLDEIDKKRQIFEQSSLDDILTYYRKSLLELTTDFSTKQGRDSVKAGSELAKKQKEEWKKMPDFGLSYSSNLLTTVTSGIRNKKFTVMSAGTGTGKTRISIANLCHSFVSKYYDDKKGEFVDNPHGKQNAVLYIGTEMELIEEIEPILWAYISKVPEEHITMGQYEDGEEERVDEAIKILGESQVYLEYIPDYDIATLERVIEEHVINHNVHHVFFDYIHITTDLISEFQDAAKAKISIREDQVLANLSTKLKDLCRKYNISIDTWTQVSGDFKNEQNRDQTIVRGAKAILDKADVGAIVSKITPKELALLSKILRNNVELGKPDPNVCISVYKNRGGSLNQVKIWLYIEYDTMRVHDCFVTDYNYRLLDVSPSYTKILENKIVVSKDKEDLINKKTKEVMTDILEKNKDEEEKFKQLSEAELTELF